MAEFFRRVEKKYILTQNQYILLQKWIQEKMMEDYHGKSTICNIYFDTNQYDFIRRSIEKPIFKEKIRLRSYNIPQNRDDPVYLEVKRKYEGIVSKRRIEMTLQQAKCYLQNRPIQQGDSQVEKELNYYFRQYPLQPSMFISYLRRSYYDKENNDLKITLDSHLLARNKELTWEKGIFGDFLLDQEKYLMEIKTLGAMPLWLTKIITDNRIYPCCFSKYGKAFVNLILKTNRKEKEKVI